MFQGRFEHSIDEKGRVAIPAPFRKRLQSSDANALVITLSDQCLAAFTPDEWQQKLDIISKLNQLDQMLWHSTYICRARSVFSSTVGILIDNISLSLL